MITEAGIVILKPYVIATMPIYTYSIFNEVWWRVYCLYIPRSVVLTTNPELRAGHYNVEVIFHVFMSACPDGRVVSGIATDC